MSNIAEGYERDNRKEFLNFLRIARGSAAEVRAQLYVAEDVQYLDENIARELRRDALAISKQLAALARTAARRGQASAGKLTLDS